MRESSPLDTNPVGQPLVRAFALVSAVVLACVSAAACSLSENESESLHVQVHGQVLSEADESPVPSAKVSIGVGGYFSVPTLLASSLADTNGQYLVEHALRRDPNEPCPLWLAVEADGFQTAMYDSESAPEWNYLGLECVEENQERVVRLRPLEAVD